MGKFGKTQNNIEDFYTRAKRFTEVDSHIKQWNSNHERTHELGHNKFSDWSHEEYRSLLTYKSYRQGKHDTSAQIADKVSES
jgi:hypothetical protein